jgi:hypothetical protein
MAAPRPPAAYAGATSSPLETAVDPAGGCRLGRAGEDVSFQHNLSRVTIFQNRSARPGRGRLTWRARPASNASKAPRTLPVATGAARLFEVFMLDKSIF